MKASRLRPRLLRSPIALGVVLLALMAVALVTVYQKERISTLLASGDEVQAEFSRDYRLVPAKSVVKVAGVIVGTVTDVEKSDRGTSIVSMKVSDYTAEKLGSEPSAAIRPTTLLGGNYYVDLQPGSRQETFSGAIIPITRTHVPTELDQILASMPQRARKSISDTTRLTDQTLSAGAGAELGRLLEDAPETLKPASSVFSGLRGTRPEVDLWRMVPNLRSLAAAMTEEQGQLARIVSSLGDVSGTLATARLPMSHTLASLPETLVATRGGLTALHGTLGRLTETAAHAQPMARELSSLLSAADPVIDQTRPMVAELRSLLRTARPLVGQLTPTARRATATLDNVRGPVLDRVNGPIAKTVLAPWKGTGHYAGNGGNGHLFYEEVGYLAAHAANLSQYGNKNGRMLGLALGAGTATADGKDIGATKFLQSLGLLPDLTRLPEPHGTRRGR